MAEVKPPAVTVTSTTPVPAGAVAVIDVAFTTVKLAAAIVPKFTAVALVNPVPVMVTAAPPAAGPLAGEIAVTVGAGGGAANAREEVDSGLDAIPQNKPPLATALDPPVVTATGTVLELLELSPNWPEMLAPQL